MEDLVVTAAQALQFFQGVDFPFCFHEDLGECATAATLADEIDEVREPALLGMELSLLEPQHSAGALGLMQVMPGTATDYGIPRTQSNRLYDIATNIMVGTMYLGDLKARFGTWEAALSAYNQGPGNFEKYGPKGPSGWDVPGYVRGVLANYERFKHCGCYWP